MTEFNPGDVVRTKGGDITVLKQCEDVLHFTDGDWGYVSDFELVKPSVPVSKIREACEGLMHKYITNDHDAGWNLAIEVLRDHLTGE